MNPIFSRGAYIPAIALAAAGMFAFLSAGLAVATHHEKNVELAAAIEKRDAQAKIEALMTAKLAAQARTLSVSPSINSAQTTLTTTPAISMQPLQPNSVSRQTVAKVDILSSKVEEIASTLDSSISKKKSKKKREEESSESTPRTRKAVASEEAMQARKPAEASQVPTVNLGPSVSTPPVETIPHEVIAYAKKNNKIEGVSLHDLGVSKISNTQVFLRNGSSIHVGGKFPTTGERLLSIDPESGQIVTDKRTIVSF